MRFNIIVILIWVLCFQLLPMNSFQQENDASIPAVEEISAATANLKEEISIGSILLDPKTRKIISFEQREKFHLNRNTSRWLSIDPMTQIYPQMSPYVYAGNFPTIAIDPDGKKILLAIKNGYEPNYEAALNALNNHSLFVQVYDMISASNEYYQVRDETLDDAWGQFVQAEDKFMLTTGGDWNPHKLEFSRYSAADNRSGFVQSTIFEEFYHAAQYETFKSNMTDFEGEIDAKVAKGYLAHTGGLPLTDNDVYISDWLQGNATVTSYFDLLSQGQPIPAQLEADFRTEVGRLAGDMYNQAYSHRADFLTEMQNFNGETAFFDQLTQQPQPPANGQQGIGNDNGAANVNQNEPE